MASEVSKELTQLLADQPDLKSVVAREVEQFVRAQEVRTTSSSDQATSATGHSAAMNRAQALYAPTLFLSELPLSRKFDLSLSLQLVLFYTHVLSQFICTGSGTTSWSGKDGAEKFVKKDGPEKKATSNTTSTIDESENRLVRAATTGLRRAIPFLSPEVDPVRFNALVESLYKVCHTTSSFATRISLLDLLLKIFDRMEGIPDRFYRLLYDQIGHFEIYHTTNRAELLRMIGTVFCSVGGGREGGSSGCSSSKIDGAPGGEEDGDHCDRERLLAFLRRLAQVCAHLDLPAAGSAALLLWERVLRESDEDTKNCLLKNTKRPADQPDQADQAPSAKKRRKNPSSAISTTPDKDKTAASPTCSEHQYDASKRDPRFARPLAAPAWELHLHAHHAHPTLSQLARLTLDRAQTAPSLLRSLEHNGRNPLCAKEFVDRLVLEQNGGVESAGSAAALPHEQYLAKYRELALKSVRAKIKAEEGTAEQSAAEEGAAEDPAEREGRKPLFWGCATSCGGRCISSSSIWTDAFRRRVVEDLRTSGGSLLFSRVSV